MTNKEAIKYLQQFYPHGGHSWLDAQRMEAIKIAIDALQEEPVSEQNLSNVQRIGKNWKEPVSEEQVKESAKTQHVNKTCKENGNSLTQEHANDDLEEAANNAVIALVPSFGQKYSDGSYVGAYRDCFKREELLELFKAGANWQKQKDEKNIGELQWNAHEEGWDECKQEMMAKAVDVTIAIPYQNGYGGYTQLVDSKEGLPFGEKLKVLVVKEE